MQPFSLTPTTPTPTGQEPPRFGQRPDFLSRILPEYNISESQICCSHALRNGQMDECCQVGVVDLVKCTKCNYSSYCGKEHRDLDARAHKAECQTVKKLNRKNNQFMNGVRGSVVPYPQAIFSKNNDIVCQFIEEDGARSSWTNKDYFNNTGFRFVGQLVVDARSLNDALEAGSFNWSHPYVSPPPSKQSKSSNEDYLAIKATRSRGLGVVATQPIPKGKIVVLFRGELAEKDNYHGYLDIRYNAKGVRSSRLNNLASLMNDGPPNCFPTKVEESPGVYTQALVASRDIQSGEEILWDYGPAHRTKRGIYTVDSASMEKLVDRLQSYGINGDISILMNAAIETEEENNIISQKNLDFRHIMGTPHTFLKLHLDGVLDYDSSLAVLENLSYSSVINALNEGNQAVRYLPMMLNVIKVSQANGQQNAIHDLLSNHSMYTVVTHFNTLSQAQASEYSEILNSEYFVQSCQLHEAAHQWFESKCSVSMNIDAMRAQYDELPDNLKQLFKGLVQSLLNNAKSDLDENKNTKPLYRKQLTALILLNSF